MKHNKIFAGLAVAGSLVAMSGAAHAISPAWAIGLAAIGGAAAGSAAASGTQPAVAAVPANPAVVLSRVTAAPGQEMSGHYEVINGTYTWVPDTPASLPSVTAYDHDGDGVLNHVDRFPNDSGRS